MGRSNGDPASDDGAQGARRNKLNDSNVVSESRRRRLVSFQKKFHECKEILEQTENEIGKVTAEYEQDLISYKDKLSKCTKELMTTKAELNNLRKKIEGKEPNNQATSSINGKTRKDESNAKIKELTRKLDESQKLSEARRIQVVSFQNKFIDCKKKLEDNTNELTSTIGRLQLSEQQAKNALEKCKKQSESRRIQVVSFQSKYKDSKQALQHMEQELERTKTELQMQSDLNTELQSQMDFANQREKQTTQRFQKLQDAFEVLEGQSTSAQQEKMELASALQKEKMELASSLQDEQQRRLEAERAVKTMKESLLEEQPKTDLDLQLAEEKRLRVAKEKELQLVQAELKRVKMLQPGKNSRDEGGARTARLKQQLHETQEKLRAERSKNAKAVAAPAAKAEKPKLSDWFVAKTNESVIKPLASSTASKSTESTHVLRETSLSEEAIRTNQESAPIEFGQTGDKTDGEFSDRIEAELGFVQSAYGEDEIRIEGRKVTRFLSLSVERDGETVAVELVITLPEGYPEKPLQATTTVPPSNACSAKVWKCAQDSISGLVYVCECEAQAGVENEALLSVLGAADSWVETEWKGIQAKKFPCETDQQGSTDGKVAICRLLIYSHHIVDPDKIDLIRKTATKLGLGGLLKSGKPGLILLEGLEVNCDTFQDSIMQQRKKLREKGKGKVDSATFAGVGKACSSVADLDEGRVLPRKLEQVDNNQDGTQAIREACQKVGLDKEMEDTCKRGQD